MNDLTREQKGRRAKEILEDPVFVEVIDAAKSGVIAQWQLTDLNEVSTRENLYMQGRGLDEVVRGLRTLITDWTVEQSRMKSSKKRRK
jgi:hypothetical protein